MDLLTPAQLSAVRQAINDASDTFNKQLITWARATKKLDYNGNDDDPLTYSMIPLLCLCAFNTMPSWPLDRQTETGIVDKDGLPIILNKDYLRGLGYLTPDGMMAIDMDVDYFILDGKKYKVLGDTQASPLGNDPTLQYLILVRDNIQTGIPHL